MNNKDVIEDYLNNSQRSLIKNYKSNKKSNFSRGYMTRQ